jgi:hypothetical protein
MMDERNDDFRLIYDQLDWSSNVEETVEGGIATNVLHPDYGSLSATLSRIEKMVREIEFGSDVGFVLKLDRVGPPRVKRLGLATRYYGSLNTFLHYFSVRKIYSSHVAVFYEACNALRIVPGAFTWGDPLDDAPRLQERYAKLFNRLVAKIHELCHTPEFKARLKDRERNAKRNEAKALALEASLYEVKSRYLVLMLHFGYRPEYRHLVTLGEIQRHRDRFLNNRRMNRLLKGIQAYIWKLEEGEKTGLHLHVLIFYTADSQRDVYIAKMIGENWMRVATGGTGAYWNSNAEKWRHAKYGHGIGTGMIDWSDTAKREALRMNILYLAKADQFLLMKDGEKCHTFGTSQRLVRQKSGRPRIEPRRLSSGSAMSTSSYTEPWR